jgi:hypothetical protein
MRTAQTCVDSDGERTAAIGVARLSIAIGCGPRVPRADYLGVRGRHRQQSDRTMKENVSATTESSKGYGRPSHHVLTFREMKKRRAIWQHEVGRYCHAVP